MNSIIKGCLGYLLVIVQCVSGVSFVYNLRIAEITRRQANKARFSKPSIGIINGIDQYRSRVDNISENVGGFLGSYIWLGEKTYVKVDAAYANVYQKKPQSIFSCWQPDDILFSAGFVQHVNDRFRFAISGKLGIPTHEDTITRGIEFGTGHVGLGTQLDCVYSLSEDKHNSIMGAARYIRYFPRTIFFPKNPQPFRFNIGNLVDLLIAYNTGFRVNRFECGYNASIVFWPTLCPKIETPLSQPYGIRSSFYGAYIRFFKVGHHVSGFITGLSYGFDNVPKLFKRIISVWLAWGINF